MTIKELRELVQKSGFKILRHEVRDFSFLYPLLDNFFFKPFRFLRYVLGKEKQEKPVELIDSCHALADRTLLRPLSSYRKYFLRIGLNQLILAQKNR